MMTPNVASISISVGAIATVVCYIYYLRRMKKKLQILSAAELSAANWRFVGRLAQLWVYPVKSCASLLVTEATTTEGGLVTAGVKDRSYLIITTSGTMVTGRMYPQSVRIVPSMSDDGHLILSYPGRSPCTVPQEPGPERRDTVVFGAPVDGLDCGDVVADWLTAVLKCDVRLLYHDRAVTSRTVKVVDAEPVTPLMKQRKDAPLYADSMSYMLLTAPSIEALQEHCERRLSARRFRPNFLVTNDPVGPALQPYDEDGWSYIRIGNKAVFRNVRPCTRCVFTCVDADTGVKDPDNETLNILKRYRSSPLWGSPMFGRLLGVETEGIIKQGDRVYVL